MRMMKLCSFLLLLASTGLAPAGASAQEQGQIAGRSQGSISIRVSVAPRLQLRGSGPVTTDGSGRSSLMCLESNLSRANFTVTAAPGPSAMETVRWVGEARPAESPAAAYGNCLPASLNADRSGDGPLVLIVRPE
jgi:hypothetical protein